MKVFIILALVVAITTTAEARVKDVLLEKSRATREFFCSREEITENKYLGKVLKASGIMESEQDTIISVSKEVGVRPTRVVAIIRCDPKNLYSPDHKLKREQLRRSVEKMGRLVVKAEKAASRSRTDGKDVFKSEII